jgi:hypothetical protein
MRKAYDTVKKVLFGAPPASDDPSALVAHDLEAALMRCRAELETRAREPRAGADDAAVAICITNHPTLLATVWGPVFRFDDHST